MATNCTNCGCSKLKCGCEDQALTTPIVYPTPAPCPDPQPCSEAFDSQCVYYTGDDILCGTDIVVSKDDTIDTALNDIVDYFCIPSVAYSNILTFNTYFDGMYYLCNGIQIISPVGTPQYNITDFVNMLNTNPIFSIYGQYFDNGDNRVKLLMPFSVAKTFCPGGIISLTPFID